MNRLAIVVLVVGLIVAELLASSINVVVTGRGEAGGVSNGGGGPLFPAINVSLPFNASLHENLSLGNFSQRLISIHLTLPHPINSTLLAGLLNLLRSISRALDFSFGINIAAAGGQGGNGVGQGSSGGQGPGSAKVGESSQAAGSPHVATSAVYLTTLSILLILLVIAAALLASITMLRRGAPRKPAPGSTVNDQPSRLDLPIGAVSGGEACEAKEVGRVKLLPKEVVKGLEGWGGSDVLSLPIPRDLPLIWDYRYPLPFSVKVNHSVELMGGARASGGSLYMPGRGCYALAVRGGELEEVFFIRATTYEEDVINFVRMNIGNHEIEDSRTLREVMERLKGDGAITGDPSIVVKAFEDVRYGNKSLSREAYEAFLTALGKAFREAKVIACEGS